MSPTTNLNNRFISGEHPTRFTFHTPTGTVHAEGAVTGLTYDDTGRLLTLDISPDTGTPTTVHHDGLHDAITAIAHKRETQHSAVARRELDHVLALLLKLQPRDDVTLPPDTTP